MLHTYCILCFPASIQWHLNICACVLRFQISLTGECQDWIHQLLSPCVGGTSALSLFLTRVVQCSPSICCVFCYSNWIRMHSMQHHICLKLSYLCILLAFYPSRYHEIQFSLCCQGNRAYTGHTFEKNICTCRHKEEHWIWLRICLDILVNLRYDVMVSQTWANVSY